MKNQMNIRNLFKNLVLDIKMETLDDLLSAYNVLIQYVGKKRWRYQVGSKGNWFTSSTYGSAKDTEKALEADIEEICATLKAKAEKSE